MSSGKDDRWLVLRLGVAFLATLGCLAAVPGDIGGCGQDAVELDAGRFFANVRRIDCEQCRRCGLTTDACVRACAGDGGTQQSFPDGCVPLVHDGEVCLDALAAASCRAYAEYVADDAPRVPTECDFCPTTEGE